jgi:hypothetical protein
VVVNWFGVVVLLLQAGCVCTCRCWLLTARPLLRCWLLLHCTAVFCCCWLLLLLLLLLLGLHLLLLSTISSTKP